MTANSVPAWTDDRIREAFIDDGGQAEYYDPINGAREQRRIAGAIFDEWLAAHDETVRASVDWRVIGGLVPGVVIAAWLRIGDRVRIAAVEGVVIAHTVRAVEDVALFVLRTDQGAEIACERWTGSEVEVVVAEEPQTADEGAQAPRPDVETPHAPSAPAPSSAPIEMTQEEYEADEAARYDAEMAGQEDPK